MVKTPDKISATVCGNLPHRMNGSATRCNSTAMRMAPTTMRMTSNKNQISTGTSATEMKITARQKNSEQAPPLLARKRVTSPQLSFGYACAAKVERVRGGDVPGRSSGRGDRRGGTSRNRSGFNQRNANASLPARWNRASHSILDLDRGRDLADCAGFQPARSSAEVRTRRSNGCGAKGRCDHPGAR